MTSKFRIAYVTPGLTCSGGIRIIFEHCDRLAARGHSVYIASECGKTEQDWYKHLKVPIVLIDNLPDLDLDVIVATGCTTPFSINDLNLKARKYYFVQGKDLLLIDSAEWKEKGDKTYRMTDYRLIAVSEPIMEWLKKEYNRDAGIVTNGINENDFFPEPTIPKRSKVRVLIEGSTASHYKGVNEAFSALKNTDTEIWWVTPSTDDETPVEVDRIWRLPEQKLLRKIYSSADIFLNLSTIAGYLLPPMEAMACGCAVIVNENDGIKDYAVNNYNCLITNMGETDAVRKAVVKLRDSVELRKKLIEGGLKTVKEKFNWDIQIDKLEKIYQNHN